MQFSQAGFTAAEFVVLLSSVVAGRQGAAFPRNRAACGHAPERVLAAPASGRNSIWNVIVPADGTSAAAVSNGDFGTSAFYGQLSDKPLPALYVACGVSDAKHNGWSRIKRRAPCWRQRMFRSR